MRKLVRAMVRGGWRGASIAFSDGQGTYLVSLLLLGAAAVFLHAAMTPEWRYRDELKKLINVKQEDFRGETHPVLSAGLLPGALWNMCEDKELAKELDDAIEEFARSLAAPGGLAPDASAGPDAGVDPAAGAGVDAGVDPDAGPRADAPLSDCDDPRCPNKTPDLGFSRTDNRTESTLIVPSTVASSLDNPQRTMSLVLASRVLEGQWNRMKKSYPSHSSLRAMYFIDLLGDLRYVPRWTQAAIPAHRTFAGASYVYQALSRGVQEVCSGTHQATTLPYLDLTGIGVIETLCRPIKLGEPIKPGASVVGTLCFDIAPPEAVVRDALIQNDVFDLHLVRDDVQGTEHHFTPCEDLDPPCAKQLQKLFPVLHTLEDAWKATLTPSAEGAGEIRLLGQDYFGAVIYRHPESDAATARPGDNAARREDVLFGRLVRSTVPDVAAAVVMMAFATTACALVVAGVRRKAQRLDMTLIRGLQVGVVEVDDRDEIIAANDRSEEIFGTQLPRFGDPPGVRDPRLFSNQIEREVVFLDDAGGLPDGVVRFSDYQEIKEQRRSGYTGSYYAFVKSTGQWIRVSGSTIVNPRRKHHTFGMLDTYIDEEHRARLIAARAKRGPLP